MYYKSLSLSIYIYIYTFIFMYIYGDGLHFVCSYIGVYRSSSYFHQCRYMACRSSRADTHL